MAYEKTPDIEEGGWHVYALLCRFPAISVRMFHPGSPAAHPGLFRYLWNNNDAVYPVGSKPI